MADVLDKILDYKRREVEAAKAACNEAALRARAEAAPKVRPFAEALSASLARGDFALIMRLYWPKDSVISGDWKPPAVKRQN